MPNPGGVYRGCDTCRKRKIKCDETFPSCRRCVVHGVTCPGYPAVQDAMFRHQTERVIQRVAASSSNHVAPLASMESDIQDPGNGQGVNKAAYLARSRSSVSNLANNRGNEYSPLIPTAPKLADSVALTSYFFHQVIMPVGWFPMLPRLYQSSPEESCLRLTVDTASVFLYCNWSRDAHLLMKARTLYISALNAINTAICDCQRRLDDETLHAILVLNILDDITGENSFVSGTHLEGCRQLLMLRDAEGYTTSCTPDLVNSVVIQTQAHLLRNSNVPWDSSKSRLTEQDPMEPAASLFDECVKIHQLRSVSAKHFRSNSGDISTVKPVLYALLDQSQAIDARLGKWPSCVEERWTYQVTSQDPTAGEAVHFSYYHDLQVAKVWNQYRGARLIVNELQVEICEKLQALEIAGDLEHLKDVKAVSIKTIALMLSEICSSIPFHLQKLDTQGRPCSPHSQQAAGGMALLWPLETVLRCRYSGPYHRQLAKGVLQEIGYVIGIRQALKHATEIPLPKVP